MSRAITVVTLVARDHTIQKLQCAKIKVLCETVILKVLMTKYMKWTKN